MERKTVRHLAGDRTIECSDLDADKWDHLRDDYCVTLSFL